MRWRGFTPLTALIGLADLAGALVIAVLWRWASAERPANDQPWWALVVAVLPLLSLLVWVLSAGRRREALAISSVIVVAAWLVIEFG